MMKGSPGVYSATYSGVPVYEFQFGEDLKEHVMRRRQDDWVNATHILKAAGFDKPARTRILEREVQKDVHEKIQGGYGKYQGTWIPLSTGEALAQRNHIYERLRPIFEYVPGIESPPPAPRHASKPKAPRPKPAVPTWKAAIPIPAPSEYEQSDAPAGPDDDETPDNGSMVSMYAGDDDRFDRSGHRKRKREQSEQEVLETQHCMYGDELLDYFLLSRHAQPAVRPEPPPNFQPNWIIDNESHTALHWASAMGDVEVIRQLKYFGATLVARNARGETPLMRAVNFTNCYDKETFPQVLKELIETVDVVDLAGCTVLHHAASNKNGRHTSQTCSRYYLDSILNKIQEMHNPAFAQTLLDAQDLDGNTALHLAALRGARKCVRALLGRNASADIANNEGTRAANIIQELNASKKDSRQPRSSSPFAPPSSQRPSSFRDVGPADDPPREPEHRTDAAKNVHTRVKRLLSHKLERLAQSYDEQWAEKDAAEQDAIRILSNSQAELTVLAHQVAEACARLNSEDMMGKLRDEGNRTCHRILTTVSNMNRSHIQKVVEEELKQAQLDGSEDSAPEERLALARQLRDLLSEQRQAEIEYVDALGTVGAGERIDKYRRLLRKCLGQDEKNLDDNLENLIEMMQEDDGAAQTLDFTDHMVVDGEGLNKSDML